MTKWTIALTSSSPDEDSKVLKLMSAAAKLGLKYQVSSKEQQPHTDIKELLMHKCRDCNYETRLPEVMRMHRKEAHKDEHYNP